MAQSPNYSKLKVYDTDSVEKQVKLIVKKDIRLV